MASEWIKLLESAVQESVEAIPKGWLSYTQVAAEWNKSVSHTRRLLAQLMQSGHIERKEFRVMTQGGVKLIPYYRMASAKATSLSA